MNRPFAIGSPFIRSEVANEPAVAAPYLHLLQICKLPPDDLSGPHQAPSKLFFASLVYKDKNAEAFHVA